jgi:hypothetical protein
MRSTALASGVAGLLAVSLAWSYGSVRFTVFVVERHESVYGVFVVGNAATAATARRAFRFVDQPD